MASEIRHLLFDKAEVTAALSDYDHRTRPAARMLSVTDMRLDDFPGLRGYLTMRTPEGGLDVVEFSAAQLAAALILFCRKQSIPLPARAAKNVRLFGGGLCLSLSLNAPPGLQAALMPVGLGAAAFAD